MNGTVNNNYVYDIICYKLYMLRCESLNSYIWAQNIYDNKSTLSHDIRKHFADIDELRYVCGGGYNTSMGEK